jgi:hypothetical protein
MCSQQFLAALKPGVHEVASDESWDVCVVTQPVQLTFARCTISTERPASERVSLFALAGPLPDDSVDVTLAYRWVDDLCKHRSPVGKALSIVQKYLDSYDCWFFYDTHDL